MSFLRSIFGRGRPDSRENEPLHRRNGGRFYDGSGREVDRSNVRRRSVANPPEQRWEGEYTQREVQPEPVREPSHRHRRRRRRSPERRRRRSPERRRPQRAASAAASNRSYRTAQTHGTAASFHTAPTHRSASTARRTEPDPRRAQGAEAGAARGRQAERAPGRREEQPPSRRRSARR